MLSYYYKIYTAYCFISLGIYNTDSIENRETVLLIVSRNEI